MGGAKPLPRCKMRCVTPTKDPIIGRGAQGYHSHDGMAIGGVADRKKLMKPVGRSGPDSFLAVGQTRFTIDPSISEAWYRTQTNGALS